MFWRPWGSVSDNFWVATVLSSPCVKIQNFPKNAIFGIFGIFECWSFWLQKSLKIVKNMKIFKNKFFTSQRCFLIPRMKFYDHYIGFYVNLKIDRKCQFAPQRQKSHYFISGTPPPFEHFFEIQRGEVPLTFRLPFTFLY